MESESESIFLGLSALPVRWALSEAAVVVVVVVVSAAACASASSCGETMVNSVVARLRLTMATDFLIRWPTDKTPKLMTFCLGWAT